MSAFVSHIHIFTCIDYSIVNRVIVDYSRLDFTARPQGVFLSPRVHVNTSIRTWNVYDSFPYSNILRQRKVEKDLNGNERHMNILGNKSYGSKSYHGSRNGLQCNKRVSLFSDPKLATRIYFYLQRLTREL